MRQSISHFEEQAYSGYSIGIPPVQHEISPFVLQMDASSSGLGVILEQGGYIIVYSSRTLNHVEQQYSVIQKVCMATVFALKQFRQ